eukprot:TRINITY_DN79_c0_g1_i3.p1 TRINITY_DN79_c0_g1~~TRINITY_DN79_c0_g1_i3.p1  ORF type:complete len:259 (-),score=48.08 TRINITY_DN79_c0_g1_i3:27-803(-)
MLSRLADKFFKENKDPTSRLEEAKAFIVQCFGSNKRLFKKGPEAAWSQRLKDLMMFQQTFRTEFTAEIELENKKYLIGHCLGSGLTANVYYGMQSDSHRPVAFKVFHPVRHSADGSPEGNFHEFANREASALKLLGNGPDCDETAHRNVIKLLAEIPDCQWTDQSGESFQTTVLVYEFATRGDLLSYIKYTGKIQPELARYIFRGLVEALIVCHHSKNIAHLDVKSDNCLLLDRVVLADFGFARQLKKEKVPTAWPLV